MNPNAGTYQELTPPYEGKEDYIFVSYAHSDKDAVFPILYEMRQAGYRFWYDEGIDPGTEWEESIANHLTGCCVFLYFMSPASIESPNCQRELSLSLSERKQLLSVVLCPVTLTPKVKLQVANVQSLYMYTYARREDFLKKLFSVKILSSCNGNTAPIDSPDPFLAEEEQGDGGGPHPGSPAAAETLSQEKTDVEPPIHKGKWKKDTRIWVIAAALLTVFAIIGIASGRARTVTVEQLGISNANMLNYGLLAQYPGEYEYFIGSDNGLYVCAFDQDDRMYYLGSSVKIHDFAGYITLGNNSVYFLAVEGNTKAVCRADKDGSNVTQLYSTGDGRAFRYLQYVKFTDGKQYLYFMLDNEKDDLYASLYRYDLAARKVQTLIEGNLHWYNLYGDSLYYTQFPDASHDWTLMKASIDGKNPEELITNKNVFSGFIEEETVFLFSLNDEALLVYNLDGTEKRIETSFYNLEVDFLNHNVGYCNGWIFYISAADSSLHRVRTNGTRDMVVMEDVNAIQLCGDESGWLWYIENTPTDKEHRYACQLHIVSRDGTDRMDIFEPEDTWGLAKMTESELEYTVSEDGSGTVITKFTYTGSQTGFEIPDEIGGKPVIGIEESAFAGSRIREIGLPESLRYIGNYAFYECKDLSFVGLPEGLETIGEGAFGKCAGLTGIDLPEGLVRIGRLAFGETCLSEVYIPANVSEIGAGAFAMFSSVGLQEFTVSKDNVMYKAVGGALCEVSGEGFLLKQVPAGLDGAYELPEGTVTLDEYSVAHCKGLTELTIPPSVVSIREKAFWNVSLTEISVNRNCKLPEELGSDIEVKYY